MNTDERTEINTDAVGLKVVLFETSPLSATNRVRFVYFVINAEVKARDHRLLVRHIMKYFA